MSSGEAVDLFDESAIIRVLDYAIWKYKEMHGLSKQSLDCDDHTTGSNSNNSNEINSCSYGERSVEESPNSAHIQIERDPLKTEEHLADLKPQIDEQCHKFQTCTLIQEDSSQISSDYMIKHP